MRASELRIGNYIKARKTTTIDENVVLLDGLQFLDLMMSSNIKYFEPIPLTEQWLIDFGFKEDTDNSFVFNNLSIFLDKRFKENMYLETKESGIFGGVSWNKIDGLKLKHVHQIQNLYFALTQKELIIK